MNNLFLRLISGVVYVALVLASVHFGNPWFTALIAFFCLMSLLEVIDLTIKDKARNTNLTALVYAGLIVYLNLFENVDHLGYQYIIALGIQWLTVFLMGGRLKAQKQPSLLLTTLYIWLPLISLSLWFTQNPEFAAEWMIFFFVTIWAYDSLAYVVGMLLGKRRIFPKTSPKKTWEGTIGGLALSALVMWFVNAYFLHLNAPVVLFAVLIALFGIWGDYFESFLKRSLGVKDSGKLIPGHGGILDRLDSILFAAIPFVVLLFLYD